jgi:hypothetical protein
MNERIYAYRIEAGKPQVKIPLGILRCRCENNKIYIREAGSKDLKYVELVESGGLYGRLLHPQPENVPCRGDKRRT